MLAKKIIHGRKRVSGKKGTMQSERRPRERGLGVGFTREDRELGRQAADWARGLLGGVEVSTGFQSCSRNSSGNEEEMNHKRRTALRH